MIHTQHIHRAQKLLENPKLTTHHSLFPCFFLLVPVVEVDVGSSSTMADRTISVDSQGGLEAIVSIKPLKSF